VILAGCGADADDATNWQPQEQEPEVTSLPLLGTCTLVDVQSAASQVKSSYELHKKLPDSLQMCSKKIGMPTFLEASVSAVLEINQGSKGSIQLKSVGAATAPQDDIKAGNVPKAEYLDIASRVETFIGSKGRAPNYASQTSLGSQMGFTNLVYLYSLILDGSRSTGKLPASQSLAVRSVRAVYVVSDNINNVTKDNARINTIINGLSKFGIAAHNYGIGPNTHLTVLSNKNVPQHALIVEIAGGADAGVIYEKGSRWYKNLLGERRDFLVFTNGATKITGLAWLPRAHDDNYDPASFTGLAHPDQFLLSHGYDYFEGLTDDKMDQLIPILADQAAR